MLSTICIAEDRPREEIAVKLLLLSLMRHCPGARIVLTYPPATPGFREWLRRIPLCELHTDRVKGSSGWNVKPYALLDLLEARDEPAWWLDSDIIVCAKFAEHYAAVPNDHLIACEEALYGNYRDDGQRTRGWGFNVARSIPYSLNTGVMRVTRTHIPLLHRWRELLEDDTYRAAQQDYWHRRPAHLMGDQDVLTALLGSDAFSDLPLHILERGRDIIQYFGFSAYTTRERVRNLLRGMPPFVHCQGWKPWIPPSRSPQERSMKDALQDLYILLSPYSYAAESYRSELGEALPWLDNLGPVARAFQLLGLRQPALTGLPLAVAFDLVRAVKNRVKPSAPHETFTPVS